MTARVIGLERLKRGKFWRIVCSYTTMPHEEADGVARVGHGAFVAVSGHVRTVKWDRARARRFDGRPCDVGDIVEVERPVTLAHAEILPMDRPIWCP